MTHLHLYVRILQRYLDTHWWQVIKRKELMKLLICHHEVFDTVKLDTRNNDLVIWDSSEMTVKINQANKILVLDGRKWSWKLVKTFGDTPRLYTPFVLTLDSDGVLVIKNLESIVGNN